MRMILIDPRAGIAEIDKDFEGIQTIYDLIGCEDFDVAHQFSNGDAVYVDGDGLINEKWDCSFALGQGMFNGVGLILGGNDEGESVDAKTPLKDILRQVMLLPDSCLRLD